MSSGCVTIETQAFVLGYGGQVATVRYHTQDGARVLDRFHPSMTLLDAGGVDDGAYVPPAVINLGTTEAIRNLLDACNLALGSNDAH